MSAKATAKSPSKVFFDTNILVYQFDRSSPREQRLAEELVAHGFTEETAVISSQVIQEFMNVALKKFKTPLPPGELEIVLRELLLPMQAHWPDGEFYMRALGLHEHYSLSFYDALIVQAAVDMNCEILYSEDLPGGQVIKGVRIVNPFASEKSS